MFIKTLIKKNVYFDSVSLMQIARKIREFSYVCDSAVIMATKENKNIIKSSGLLSKEIASAKENDLAIAVSAKTLADAQKALKEAESLFKKKDDKKHKDSFIADSVSEACKNLPDLNMALISVNGKYAGALAQEALDNNLNVMIFSDNVPLETEIKLKSEAKKKNLLLMGPDCGTAIINGAPLGFANVVNRGNIAVLGPSGTGIQELTSIVSNLGGGISQAIGVGTRDVKNSVNALSTLYALDMLSKDENTDVIAIVSKPPEDEPMKKIMQKIKSIKKPVVAVFIGLEPDEKTDNFYCAKNIHEAALKAFYLAKKEDTHKSKEALYNEKISLASLVKKEKAKKNTKQKYLRGLFSGGTFAAQAIFTVSDILGKINSNISVSASSKLKNSLKMEKHSIIDLGEDEFTFGRPHPMIDYSLRNSLIEKQSFDKEVSVILLDIVLGYGSNLDPLAELKEPIKKAFAANPSITIIAAVTGTNLDPQNKRALEAGLKDLNVAVFDSNYIAALAAAEIVRR